MADFQLDVRAKLAGLQELQSQINNLVRDRTINIRANTNNVITQIDEIQNRLTQLNNTRVNLGNIGGSDALRRQNQQANELAHAYTRLINLARTMGSIEVRLEGLNAGRNAQQINVLTHQFERVSSEYNNLRSTLEQSIDPAGFQRVDDIIAQTTSRIQELHARMGDTAAFNQQQQAINEVDFAFREMLSLIGQIGTTRVQMAGLEDTSNQFVLLQNRLEHLQEQYNALNNQFGDRLNAGQTGRVEQAFAAIDSRVENVQARLSDVNLNNLVHQIEQIETKIHRLNTTNNGNQMDALRSQLDSVRQQYESLLNDIGNPNVNANNAFSQVIENIRGRLNELDAVWTDKQNRLAKGIELKVNTGKFESDIAKVTSQYEKLGNTGHPILEQVRNDIQQLTVLQQQMANAGDNTTLISTYNQYNEVLQRVRSLLQTVSADAKTFVSSLQISQLDNKIQIWAENNSRATKEFGSSILELRQRLAILQQSGRATASDLDAIRIEFEKIKSAAISAGQTGVTFGNLMKQSLQTIMRYFSVTTLIYKGIAAIKEMCKTVLEVDTAMTGLYRVTEMTASQYDSLFNQMAESAKRYGASLSEIIDATTTWVKLGFDASTAQKLGNITTMYQHVTDLDTETAVNNLVTAYKGFQDELNNLYAGDTAKAVSYVADIFDKLNNEFAVTAAQVGEGLTNSASALAVAGNSIQESSAMLTGIVEVTQNASKAGAALRILSMRLRGTKAQVFEELGEDTEGVIEVVSKLQDKIKDISGVDIVDANNQLRSTYEIIGDIADVWDALDTNRKALLLETIAGKNRASDIAALIRQWDTVEAAMQAAIDAEGTAMQEQSIYMESLQGHLDVLSATYQKFATNLINANFLKYFVDIGTGALEALNGVSEFISEIGGMQTVIMAVVAALLLAKGGLIAYKAELIATAAVQKIVTLFTGVRNAVMSVSGIIPNAVTAWRLYSTGVVSASSAMQASIPIIGLVLSALTLLVGGLTLANNKINEARDKRIGEAFDSAKSNNELEKNVITIEKYAGKVSLAADEETQFASATKGASDALGGKVTAIENATEAQEDYLNALRETTKEELQRNLNTAKRNVKDTSDVLKNKKDARINLDNYPIFDFGFGDASDIAKEVMHEYVGHLASDPDIAARAKNIDDIVDYYYKLIELRDKLTEANNDDNNYIMNSRIYKETVEAIGTLENAVESYTAARLEQLKLEYEIGHGIPTTVEEYAEMRNAILETIGASEEARAEYSRMLDEQFKLVFNISYFDTVSDAIDKIKEQFYTLNLGKASNDAFNEWLDSMSFEDLQLVYTVSLQEDTTGYTLEDWKKAIANYKPPELVDDEEESKLNGVAKALKSLSDGYDVLEKAKKDMAAGKGLTADTIQAMSSYLEDDEDITQYLILNKETGYLELDIDAWNRRAEAMISSDTTDIDMRIAELKRENEELERAGINYEELAKKMQQDYEVGNVKLTERPIILGADMKKAGWNDAGDGYSTLYSSTYTAGSGSGFDYKYNQDVVVSITPIMENGKVLSPEELDSYMAELLKSDNILEADAVENGGLGLVLNVTEVTGSLDDARAAAESWAVSLHDLQAEYYGIAGNTAIIQSLNDLKGVYESLMKTVSSEADLSSMFDGLEDVGKKTENIRSAMEKLSNGTALTPDELESLAKEYTDLMKVDGFLDMTSVKEQQSALEGVYAAFESRFNSLIDTQLTLLEASRAEAVAENKSTSVFDAMIANLTSIKENGIKGLFDVGETQKTVTQYDLISDAISGVKKASDALTEINSSDRDTMSIFSSIVDMAEKSKKSITDFVSVVDGELQFNETAITSWATTLVNNLDQIPGMTQEIKDAFIEQIKAEEDASKSYEDISKAISNVGKASNLLTDIQEFNVTGEGDILGMLSNIVEMAELTKQSVSDFVNVTGNGLQFSEKAITDWANSFIDSLDVDASLKDYLKNQVKSAYKAKEEYEKLSDAMEKVNAASGYMTKINDKDASFADKFSAAIKMLEEMPDGTKLDDLLSFDENGQFAFKTETVTTWINKYIDDMVTAGTVSEELGEQMKKAAEATEEQVSSYDKVTTAISNAQKAADLLTNLHAPDFGTDDAISALETVTDMAKATGQDISAFVSVVDGELQFNEQTIKAWADKYIDALLGIEGLPENIAEEIREIVKANEELANSYQKLSTAVGNVKTASGLLTDIDEYKATGKGDILGMFSTIVSMAEETKQPITDFFSFVDGKIQFTETAISGWSDSFINSLEVGDDVKEYLRGQVKSAYEAADSFETLSNAIKNVNSVSSYLTKIQSDDVNFIDVLSDAVSLLKDMPSGTTLNDFFQINDDGSITYLTDSLTTWINKYIDDMVTAGTVTKELGAQMKEAAKAEIDKSKSINALIDTMSKVENAANLISTAQTEMAEDGKTSVQTVIALYEKFGSEASKMFTFTGDGFIIDTGAIKTELYSVIDDLEDVAPEIKQAMKNVLDVELEEEDFSETVDTYVSKVQTLQNALQTLRTDGELSDSALYDLVKDFPSLADETDNLEGAITNLIGSMNSDIIAEFNKQLDNVETDEERKELEAFMQIVLKLGEVVGKTEFAIDISAEVSGMDNLFNAIKESVSETGLAAESIDNLKKRYASLPGADISKLFERTEHGIHLNTKALRGLESQYESFNKNKIDKKLDDLVKEYNNLTEQIDSAGIASSTVDLYAQRSKILQQINETADLAAQYAGLTSNFYAWEQAQSMGEEGDMYDSLAGGLENIGKLYKEGLIGTNKFRTAVQLMSNKDLSNATQQELIDAYKEGYPLMKRYFQDGSDGVLNFLHDVEDFNSEWVHLNEDGSWDIDFGVGGDEEVAKALGINVEAVQAILRKLSDYGFDINLDTMYSSLDTMQSKAENAAKKLKELGKTNVEFKFDATNIARIDEQIEEAKKTLDKFRDSEGKIDLSLEGAEEAQYVLATLVLQKQALEDPFILKVDAGNIEGVVGETLRKLQTIKQQYNNLKLNATIGADTTGIQAEINTTLESFTPEEIQILSKLGIDTTASLEDINAAILGITPNDLVVKANVDTTLVDEYLEKEQTTTATVKWINDTSAVIKKFKAVGVITWNSNVSSSSSSSQKKQSSGGIISNIVNGAKDFIGNVGKIFGFDSGTAYANGNWSTNQSGTALGGELGREIVVRDGKFFTIGDFGAEFFKYKKGDIIFNHKQTEQLLENGKIIGAAPRGKVFSSGTAFSNGANGVITSSGSVITKPSGNGGSDGEESQSSITDWIEIAIDRIERAINKLSNIAQSAYKSLDKRLSAGDDQIKKTIEDISLQSKAYTRYMQKAESIELSNELKTKVQNGEIDINEYDEEISNLISSYQEWYEKAIACSEAIDELHMTLSELYAARFEMVQQDAEAQIALIEHMTNTFSNSLDLIEAKGYIGGKVLYSQMASIESELIKKYKTEIADMQILMSEAVGSGEIDIGSEEYYNMQQAINDVKESLQEAQIAFEEYNNAVRQSNWDVFDYLEERISKIVDESNFLIELIGNANLFDDKGVFNEYGNAVFGLHAVNYNTYMEQADQYAREIHKINEDIAKDPYDTMLIERKENLVKLQQDSILAAEGEKYAIQDLVESGIEAELAAIKELIDAYQDSLQSSKDLYDYQKKIKKNTKEVASLQKQLAAYQNDMSEENRARIQKLQVDLETAKEDLQETQYNQYIKDQKELLNNLYDEYEEALNSRLDNIDALISGVIDEVNANSGAIRDTLVNVGADVGYTLTGAMTDIWDSDSENGIAAMYGNQFSSQLTTIQSVIQNIETLIGRLVDAGNEIASDTISNASQTTPVLTPQKPVIPTPTPTTPTTPTKPTTPTTTEQSSNQQPTKQKVKIINGTWWVRKGAGTDYKHVDTVSTGSTFEYGGESTDGWNSIIYKGEKRWVSKKGSMVIGYSNGGIIADLQKTAFSNGDDMITVNTLKKGEAILTPAQTVQFSKFAEHLPQLQGIIDTSSMISEMLNNNSTNSVNQIQYNVGGISFPINHVSDYNDLVEQMQRDEKFERFIQSMTVDRIVGGSKFAKYKQKFN